MAALEAALDVTLAALAASNGSLTYSPEIPTASRFPPPPPPLLLSYLCPTYTAVGKITSCVCTYMNVYVHTRTYAARTHIHMHMHMHVHVH